jgi:NitT/TauT family transport system ATP-binding protein
MRAAVDGVAGPSPCSSTSQIPPLFRPSTLASRPIGVEAEALRRTLDGRLGAAAETRDYLLFGDRASGRPERHQAAWLYAQMLRWGQARFCGDHLRIAESVFDPAFFDAATNFAVEPARRPIMRWASPQT